MYASSASRLGGVLAPRVGRRFQMLSQRGLVPASAAAAAAAAAAVAPAATPAAAARAIPAACAAWRPPLRCSVRHIFSTGPPDYTGAPTTATVPPNSSSSSSSSSSNREKAPTRRATGLHKVCNLGAPLAEFMGRTQASRVEVTKFIWSYIKEKGLQKKDNKRIVVADERLLPLLQQRELSMFTLNKVLSQHIHNTPQQDKQQQHHQQREDGGPQVKP
ncbi:SWIB/MDM2 domain-containing protein, putative [Eimeria acervulina]|uniref:SWIB/MDM2 domain-containing protein, putative n=1 Tax=Eimeria acervulina TaxID=5801 RepID=U6GTG5_EIMAC|nr:SWIB/MDM2 domain-containing protein, putative [Eimeria acervulina]CDI82867.1 SWIB/MDM2 domain-containing protein, putative [Eimeria acervulina]